MTKASDNEFPKVILAMQSSDATIPSDSDWKLYAKADGIYARSSNSVVGPFLSSTSGAVATDDIWDAAGDLVQGTGANTAAKLTAGTAGQFLKSAGPAAANLWAYPPGYELDYVQITSPVTVTGTAEGTETTVITGTSQSYAAEAIMIEFFSPRVTMTNDAAARALVIDLYDGATILGRMATYIPNYVAGQTPEIPITAKYRLTPTAATHQYIIKAWDNSTSNCTIGANSGGTGANMPAYLRVTKV